MTLLVAMANDSIAVVVADRRLTRGQTVLDEEFNKVTVLFCRDAKLTVAFTGLATFGNFNTSEWLAETLFDICDHSLDVHSVIAELVVRAGKQFSLLAANDRRLTIILCGFVYWSGTPEQRIYVISNFEHGNYSPGSFTTVSSGSTGQSLVEVRGQSKALPERTLASLRSLLERAVPHASLVRFAVRHLQNAANNVKSLNGIGEHCNAAVVRSGVDTLVTATYHTTKNAQRAYGPNVVVAKTMICLGYEVMAPSIVAGPEIRKQDPCWCGSGDRFKHCHMKKYGGIYVQDSAWTKPLIPFVRGRNDEGWPSGRVFSVWAGYE